MSLDVHLRVPGWVDVHHGNLTHNLGPMAEAAGLYAALWRPTEAGYTTAADIVPILRAGRERLLADPNRYRALNPSNGWGTYEGLVSFVSRYLGACEANLNARIEVSR